MMKKTIQSSDGAITLTIVGKINLPSVKKQKREFVPYSGGFRLKEVWPK